ncbi:hypothetical protein Tco_1036822 [Tanacetum coccineum]
MSKDQSILRRNKVDWHMANNDLILTIMRFIPKHETVQKYGVILPDTLTNQAMKESDAYKIYHDFATGKVIPKPKYVRRPTREKTDQAPTAPPGKRLKATAKVARLGKKKQLAQGLETLSKIALSEAEQIKIVTKRSKTQFYNSYTSSSGANEGAVSLSKDDDANADNEDDDGQDDDNEQTKSDNDGEDFVYPKFSTHDEEERQEEDKEEDGSDLRVQTPSHFESTNDEAYDEVTQEDNVEGEELNEKETNEEGEVNELCRDVNVNLERRDTEMTDANKIEKFVNDQLEAKVLIRSSNKAKTSHVVAANLSEIELKKILNDKDEDEEPSAGSNRGSKRRRARKEPESTSAPKEKISKSNGKSKEGSKSRQTSTGKSAQAEEPIHADEDLEEPAHQEFDAGFIEDQPISTLARNKDPRESFNELMNTPLDFLAFVLNPLKVDTLTPELLAGPTFELMKGSCKSLVELEYFLEEVCKATTDQLDWNNPEGQQYPHDLRKPLPLIHNLRDDDKLYTFKESDYNRLRLQDIEDMLLLLVQGKLTNLNIKERLALGVKLRISDLKRKTPYTAYSNPKGFIYQNKYKKNIFMRIDELHKFSDGTLNDVRSTLNDILKRIRMKLSLHDDEELSLHDDASLAGSLPASNKGDAPAKPPQIITTNTLSNIKLPVLQKDDYDTWAMEMEHYLEYIDNEV